MHISSKLRLGALALAISTLAASPSFAQADVDAVAATVTPQNGFWSNPNEPGGRGLVLEAHGAGEIFSSLLTYDDTNRAVWYVIQTRTVNGSEIGELQQFVGGQQINGLDREGIFLGSAGLASYSFDTPTSGTLTLPTGAMPITRHNIVANGVASGPAAGAPAGGWWYNLSESGRGYFLEAQGSTLSFKGMMYDDLGQATWYSAEGAMTTPTLFTGTLTNTFGGQTMGGAYRLPTQSTNHGTITIQFTSATTATLTNPAGRQIPIIRYTF